MRVAPNPIEADVSIDPDLVRPFTDAKFHVW